MIRNYTAAVSDKVIQSSSLQHLQNSMGNGPPQKTITNDKSKTNEASTYTDAINLKRYTKLGVIGRGGFGKVWKIESKKDKKLMALKQMSKANAIQKERGVSDERTASFEMFERRVPYQRSLRIPRPRESVPGDGSDKWGGPALPSHQKHTFRLAANQQLSREVEFFAACILTGLEVLHNRSIVHRDLKPQNLVFQQKGYLRITDLGIARIWKPENSTDTSGTPGYMAPQVMCRCNHGVAVDYYALGVIVFQCMFGYRPYVGTSRQEIRDKVLAKQVQIRKGDIPENWSQDAADFVNRLIQRKPQNRLGNNGPDEVMAHPWFRDVNWQKLRRKQARVPFNSIYNPDQYQQQLNNVQEVAIPPQTVLLLKKQAIQNLFAEYHYDGKAVQNPLLFA